MTNGGLRVELNGGAPYTPVVISVFHTQHRGRDAALRRPRAVQARNVRPSAGPPSQGQRARFRRCMRRGGRSAPSLTEFAGPALSKCEISGLESGGLAKRVGEKKLRGKKRKAGLQVRPFHNKHT